ncbi:MAG TPA: transcription-repair coupling factor [Chloroflexota bacterium]|nr:transcription-repair coupling factor [Chloroflexota bacterium]
MDVERPATTCTTRLSIIDAAQPYLVAGLVQRLQVPTVVVAAQASRAKHLADQISLWVDDPDRVHLFAEPDALFYERLPGDRLTIQKRLVALTDLGFAGRLDADTRPSPPIVVASARALMHPIMTPNDFESGLITLARGLSYEPGDLAASCLRLGYQPAPIVDEPGTFSRRGGIFDVFPPTETLPVRIEFFDDEVDSLRWYDPETQRSGGHIERVTIVPASEVLAGPNGQAVTNLRGVDVGECAEDVRATWERDILRLEEGESFAGIEFYASFLAQSSLFDYLGARGLVIVDDREQVEATVHDLVNQAEDLRGRLIERQQLPRTFPVPYLDWSILGQALSRVPRRLDVTWHDLEVDVSDRSGRIDGLSVVPQFGGRVKSVIDECAGHTREGRRVVLVSQQNRRLAELFGERDLGVVMRDDLGQPPEPGTVTLVHGTVAEGFQLAGESSGLVLMTDRDVFGWSKPKRAVRPRPVARDAFLSDVSPGDLVVHVEHGVGKYRGLVHMAPDGSDREYLWIDYTDDDRLYVPIEQADRVGRYVGAGDHSPVLHRLGTSDWARVKDRVKSAVREMAHELLSLYAARAVKDGHAFTADGAWQAELEDSFPYVETPDQMAAIRDVKIDMERPKPMDRLLCGDVGYGKTEVALRAAFKAVMDGKQVALLVPTTVLAQQHFNTFRERMQAFPVRIEMLSRFRSAREQAAIVDGLAKGQIDICIGTHRLVQKDVVFKNLGLVIVDEEQRFGVAHKERLKKLRREVDVLTLTATPIPRTLHMALAGVRDLSTMDTPPEDRLPIRTYVQEWSDDLVREVVLREIERGGQVYVVHNRVQTIYQLQQRLQNLVPEATFVVGHGQLPEAQLERVMLEFADGQYDVLVCTTIIESGLDIPNTNTILVDHADKLGLAQLYQLRGRVGRGANRAYAYLLYKRDRQLSELADQRLKAIFESTELGAGFRIAMKDLELRGAGNLLGAEQSGYVAAVGFHLYTQLLAEAVAELQGKREDRLPDVAIDLPLGAYLPANYVSDEHARLSIYQRFASATTLELVGSIVLELRDRFGPLPDPALDLSYLVQLKVLAALAGVAAITTDDDVIIIRFHVEDRERNRSLAEHLGARARVGRTHAYLDRAALGANWQPIVQQAMELIQIPTTREAMATSA